jgi:hypothetical protein
MGYYLVERRADKGGMIRLCTVRRKRETNIPLPPPISATWSNSLAGVKVTKSTNRHVFIQLN